MRRLTRAGRALAWRTLTADLWMVRLWFLLLSAFSGAYFLLPFDTYGIAPRAYVGMAWLLPERAWGHLFLALAVLTALTLYAESRESGPVWCAATWQLHAALWSGIGASFAINAPGAWSSWIFVAYGAGAELIVVQPYRQALGAAWRRLRAGGRWREGG